MTTVENEKLTIAQVAKLVSHQRGRKTYPTTIGSWIRKGLLGVRLQAEKIGGRFLVKKEALGEFTEAVSAATNERRQRNQRLMAHARTFKGKRRDV